MSNKEIAIAVRGAVDLIDATAIDMNSSRGGIASKLLRREDLNPITKRAALIVTTEELIKQNPARPPKPGRSGA
jgi:hypothetical protein